MQTLISIIIALIIFSVLVVFHEFGHFIVARLNGVVVEEFSVGMGPRLLKHKSKKSGTVYSLKAFPIGGSCAMLGEDEDNEEEGSFNSKSVWRRLSIVFAGPFFNFVLAFFLALIVIASVGSDPSTVVSVDQSSNAYKAGLRKGDYITNYDGTHVSIGREMYLEDFVAPIDGSMMKLSFKRDGKSYTIHYKPDAVKKYILGMSYTSGSNAPTISQVTKDSAFEKAGVKRGDIVMKIDGVAVKTGEAVAKYLVAHPLDGKVVNVLLKRNNKTYSVKVKPIEQDVYSPGFIYNMARVRQDFFGTIRYSFVEMRYQVMAVLKSLKMLVTGKVAAEEVSGPVGIVKVIGDTYKETRTQGFGITLLSLVSLAILLSANLGVMNLLPIPALDGGRILLYIVEIVTRKKIPRDKEGAIHFVGFIILMALMVLLVFNDVRKIFF